MDSIVKSLVAIAMAGSLAACGQSGEKKDAVPERNINGTSGGQTSGVFDSVESKMGEQMMTAVGASAGDNWVRKMIAHHQGAIDMSKAVLDQDPTSEVAKMAKMTIEKQGGEIKLLEKLEEKGSPDQKSAVLYKPAMMQMQGAMMAAAASSISETYLRKMLAHHEGAIAMSDIALKNGATGRIRDQVEKTKRDQQQEANAVKSMIAKPST